MLVSKLVRLALHIGIVLVIACPDDDRGMVPELLDGIDSFAPDVLTELGDHARVVPATECKILPDEDAKLVTRFVEDWFFVDTATPYSKSLDVTLVSNDYSQYPREEGLPNHDLVPGHK